MLFIKPSSKPSRITIAITITSLIIVIFLLAGHGTAYGSVPKPDRGFDLAAGHDKPEGAWSNNTTIWVVSEDDDRLYAYSLATGARLEDRDIELSGGNDDPQGIVARNSIMFVADWDDTKLYAYRLSDGQARLCLRSRDREVAMKRSNSGRRRRMTITAEAWPATGGSSGWWTPPGTSCSHTAR